MWVGNVIHVEYYQPAFAYIHGSYAKQIEDALLSRPLFFRRRFVKENIATGFDDHSSAWSKFKKLLDELEAEIVRVLSRHSVFFWMHIYRRIGVHLHPLHENKVDARTIGLVREIVELAITRYGHMENLAEFGRSDILKPDLIMGGLFKKAFKVNGAKHSQKVFREFARLLRSAPPQWVLRRFCADDLVDMYYVEGLAYQYWHTATLLRMLGKGFKITINDDGDWEFVEDYDLSWLTDSIDERTETNSGAISLVGMWFDEGRGSKIVSAHPCARTDCPRSVLRIAA
jgi:hypothetical protein